MSDDQLMDQPEGKVAALFSSKADAEAACAALVDAGHNADSINQAHGTAGAEQLDDSARWFADTDDHIEIYKDHLAKGSSAIAVPVDGEEQVDRAREIFRQHHASMMTHFGGVVTTSESLK